MLARALRRVFILGCSIGAGLSGAAQSPNAPPPPDQQTYTLHVNTRAVLTDVTVTDSHGNTIHDLPESDFEIYDDGRPQKLNSFEEHVQTPDASPAAAPNAPNVYSNESLLHTPSTLNVILIDTSTIGIIDQMYLYEELTKFVQKLPSGEPVAIFNRAGQATLLLQDFTADHNLLMAAIHVAIPHLRQPDVYYATGSETLEQIAGYLAQIPGRKNVLWFSGGSNAFLQVDPVQEPERRLIYDQLEAERIAIYPIDARGLTVNFGPYRADQQMLMEQDADSTGGHAYFNNNGLARITSHVVSSDGSYYTLTYSPDDTTRNGRWHTVKVRLNNSHYQLSYRRGYFDDGYNDQLPQSKTRTALRANGELRPESTAERSRPIVFKARVLPASLVPRPASLNSTPPIKPERGATTYAVHYDIPARDIQAKSTDGNNGLDVLGIGIIVFSHYGTPVEHLYQEVRLTVNEAGARNNPNANLGVDQQINLPKGRDYLYIVVWDMTTGRLGNLSVPLDVKEQPKLKR